MKEIGVSYRSHIKEMWWLSLEMWWLILEMWWLKGDVVAHLEMWWLTGSAPVTSGADDMGSNPASPTMILMRCRIS